MFWTLGQQFAPGLQHSVRPAEHGDHSHLLEENSLPRLPADRRDHGQAVRVQLGDCRAPRDPRGAREESWTEFAPESHGDDMLHTNV